MNQKDNNALFVQVSKKAFNEIVTGIRRFTIMLEDPCKTIPCPMMFCECTDKGNLTSCGAKVVITSKLKHSDCPPSNDSWKRIIEGEPFTVLGWEGVVVIGRIEYETLRHMGVKPYWEKVEETEELEILDDGDGCEVEVI